MLFMVIEQFNNADPLPVRERFEQRGRMLPDDVAYINSWIDPARGRCFQLMEAPDATALAPWIAAWSDLVEFDVVPVMTSASYWGGVRVD